jgi:hypothetical protein
MAQGFSLHIGLNGVDATKYNNWAGTLSGCVNHANAMQAICASQGFTTQMLLDGEASAGAILGAIGQAAFNLQSGDTFVISYSGHGGQVPDTTGASPNGLDDTWVAYDRMVPGHELYNLWGQFAADVRIEVYSDSCHSGTVIRGLFTANGAVNWPGARTKAVPLFETSRGMQNFKNVYAPAGTAAMKSGPPDEAARTTSRAIPPTLALQLFERDQAMYETAQWSRKRGDIAAAVILISGCQDNQESQDGQKKRVLYRKVAHDLGQRQLLRHAAAIPASNRRVNAIIANAKLFYSGRAGRSVHGMATADNCYFGSESDRGSGRCGERTTDRS